jgi:hypothetical protein
MIEKYTDALYKISPNIPRDDWVKTAMASKAVGIDFNTWDSWSSYGETYNAKDAKSVWQSSDATGGITGGTLLHMAGHESKKNGLTQSPRNDYLRPINTEPLGAPKRTPQEVMELFASYPAANETHFYIEKKQGWADDLKQVPNDSKESIRGVSLAGALVIPCMDGENINTLQYITPSEKLNLANASFGDGYFMQGHDKQKIYVTEGIGQLWAAIEATGFSTACTFGVGRTKKVVSKLKELHPTSEIIICADAGKEIPIEHIARELQVKAVFMPLGWPENSDINDLMIKDGIPALKTILERPQAIENMKEANISDGLEPLSFIFASELGDTYEPPEEIVEGVLTAGDGSVLYGDSNSGKTFLVIDMACAIARGIDWMDRKTEKGLVIYLAAESPSSVKRRVQGYQKHHNVKVPNFVIVQSPIDLFDGDGDTNRVINLVKAIEAETQQKCLLIVGDTLARLSAGANENAGQDMSIVVRHFDQIRTETSAHFLLIHHSGKNAAAGARGWSGVRAAVDTEMEVTDLASGRCCEITKQRDLSTKGERIGFMLESVPLGYTKWNKPSAVAVVVPADAPKANKGNRLSEIAGAIEEYLSSLGKSIKKVEVVKHFDGKYDKSSVYRELKKLTDLGKVYQLKGMVGAEIQRGANSAD